MSNTLTWPPPLDCANMTAAFTPTGHLRAAINLGNPILAGKRAGTGEVYGVSVDLARGFAQRLGVAFRPDLAAL